MKLRLAKLAVVLWAAALVASGCSSNLVSATPTPVAYKACMSVSPAGLSDGGLNQNAYFGLQQAAVQYGVGISATEASETPSVGDYEHRIQRLIKRGCNLVFAVGGNQNAAVYTKARANPRVSFVLVDQPPYVLKTAMRSTANSNVQSLTYDPTIPAFQAGYLAAAHSTAKVVGVLAGASDKVAQAQVWYFMQGVERYNLDNPDAEVLVVGASGSNPANWWTLPESASPKSVKLWVGHLLALGADVVFPVGVNGLAAAQQVALTQGAVVIGSNSDWFSEPRYSTVKNVILASVHKVVSQDVANLVGAHFAQSQSTATASPGTLAVIVGQVKLSPQHGVDYGSATQGQLDNLAQQISAGLIPVTAFPQ
jgi:basic membrane protein A